MNRLESNFIDVCLTTINSKSIKRNSRIMKMICILDKTEHIK